MEILTYFSRSIIVLLSFLIVHQITFRKDGHFTLYRVFLLLGVISSLILPLLVIHYTVHIAPLESNGSYKEIEAGNSIATMPAVDIKESVTTFNWFILLEWIYFLGVAFFAIRILYGVIHVSRLMRVCSKKVVNGFTFYVGERVVEPFTFGSYIFIKEESYLNNGCSEILAHEKIHAKQHHWFDVFLCELLIAIEWFNPFAWYYGRVVKQNLEFIADQGVLSQGYSIEKYIQSIISVTMGAEATVLANHFRFSQNKKRLKMMKNVRKSKWRQLKLLIALPLIGVFLWSFSEPVYQYDKVLENNVTQQSQDSKEIFCIKGRVHNIADTIDIRQKDGSYVRKVLEDPLLGTSIIVKGTTRGTLPGKNGNFELEVSPGDEIVFSYVGYKTKVIKVEDQKPLDIKMVKTVYELDPTIHYEIDKQNTILPKNPNEEPLFVVVEEMPTYVGGNDLFFEKLKDLVKNEKAKKSNLSGVVKVSFKVNTDGKIEYIQADKMKGSEVDIARKMVFLLGDWNPGRQRGKAVICRVCVPVDFD